MTSRDPNDLTREDPNYVAIAQDYAFAIEAAIKGEASGTITVTIGSTTRRAAASFKRVERLTLLLNLHTLKRNRRDKEATYERIIAAAQ